MQYQEWLRKNKYVALIAVAVLGLLLLVASKYLRTQQKPKAEFIKPLVTTVTVSRQPMYKSIALFGKTTPLAKLHIVNKYPGRLAAVNVDLGDEVEAGELLIEQELQDVELKLALAKAKYEEYQGKALAYEAEYKADYFKYKAAYELHKINFERYERLHAVGAVSKLEVDNVRQTMINAQAAFEELANQPHYGDMPAAVHARYQDGVQKHNDYLLLLNQREDMLIKAPRRGVISYRNAEVGSYVPAGTRLLTLVDNSGIYIDCIVSEQDAAMLKVGQAVDVDIEAIGGEFKGEIIYVSPAASEESNGFAVRLALLQPTAEVKAGLFAKSEFNFLQKENAIFLDKNNIVEKNGKQYVYLLDNKLKVEQRQIKTGIRNNKVVEIIKGVREGDVVVTSNLSRLRNGVVVEVSSQEDVSR